jgi:malonate-semialdehyde dehydrogenase (acetylating)/methylmalonate-semialdehyde dehydrogenase
VPVGRETADALAAKLTERVRELKIGPSLEEGNDYGPLVTAEAKQRVERYIQLGVDEGATLLTDGRGFSVPGYEDGFYLGPTLFDHVRPEHTIYREEIFGPVLIMVRADTYEEALALPSQHEYGNGVSIFTRDGDTARDFTARVNVGMVGVNVPIPVPIAYHTFGGWKKSGFGDRLVLQVDGGHHVGSQRTADIAHDAELMLMGFHVIRVGYDQVVNHWPDVQAILMRAIAQGLHEVPRRAS